MIITRLFFLKIILSNMLKAENSFIKFNYFLDINNKIIKFILSYIVRNFLSEKISKFDKYRKRYRKKFEDKELKKDSYYRKKIYIKDQHSERELNRTLDIPKKERNKYSFFYDFLNSYFGFIESIC